MKHLSLSFMFLIMFLSYYCKKDFLPCVNLCQGIYFQINKECQNNSNRAKLQNDLSCAGDSCPDIVLHTNNKLV